jgi:hypothetical protein
LHSLPFSKVRAVIPDWDIPPHFSRLGTVILTMEAFTGITDFPKEYHNITLIDLIGLGMHMSNLQEGRHFLTSMSWTTSCVPIGWRL